MKSRFLLCEIFVSLLCGCTTEQDLGRDPHSTFGAIQGRVFRLRREMLVYPIHSDHAPVWLVPAGQGSFGYMPIAILPIGARIRVAQAIRETNIENDNTFVYVSIEDGKLAGTLALVMALDVFFDPAYNALWDRSPINRPPVTQWTANPKYLTPETAEPSEKDDTPAKPGR